ncbi:RHS repeat-associated core domain-containing protein [Euzebya pacifica]|uniref:RHS repeat-associated core domain-containing protein n=1 Tax=Euzebya pacifica TaxID=1608957 RepID=UPI0013DED0A2|nr:RHS repeat-associated core domain-containing protein [Euzebya pacifica]
MAERGEFSKVWEMSDGSQAVQVTQVPLHVRTGEGWVDVDASVTARPDGSFVAAGLPVGVELPAEARGPVRVVDGEVSVAFALTAAGGPGRAERAVAASQGRAEADRGGVAYAGVAAGVSLVYRPFVGGVKEAIVLEGPDAPTSFVFDVATVGLELVADERGVRLVDADGQVRFIVAPPFMEDAAGVRSDGVELRLDGRGRVVQTITDTDWLADPGRVWPVTVDPTVSSTAWTTDCQLHEDAPSLTDCGSATGVIGDDGTGEHRMIYHFGLHGVFDEPVQVIQNAAIRLTRTTVSPGSATDALEAFALTAPFDPGWVSWNNRENGQAWGSPGGDFGPREYGTAVSNPGEEVGISVDRHVQQWLDGPATDNYGILLKTDDSDYYRVHTEEATDPAVWPSLWIRYNPLFGIKDQYGLESFTLSERRDAHVNLASGNLTVRETDVDLVGVAGHDARVVRQYDSRFDTRTHAAGGTFGPWWNAGWNWQVLPSDGVRLEAGESGDRWLVAGAQWHFPYNSVSGGWDSPEGSDLALHQLGSGEFLLTFVRSGEVWTFSAGGILDTMVDRHGNAITMGYATSGYDRPTTMTDSRGQTTSFDYSSNTWNEDLTGYTDPAGRSYGFTYTGDAEIETFTDPDGNVTTYTYDNDHNLTGIEDAEGNHTLFDYDTDGRVVELVRVDDPVGMTGPTWLFDYSTAWETVVTDPNGHDTTYAFDRQGRITEVEDALGRDRQTSWTASASVASFSDLDGNATINTYSTDARYNLESVELPTGAQTAFAYTDTDNPYAPSAVTSPQGNTTSIDYDSLGRPVTITDPTTACSGAACTQTISYNADGTIDSVTDPNGNVTDYTYNSDGELIRIDHPAPRADVSLTYDSIGRPVTVTDGNGITTTYGYDRHDRVVSVDHPTDPDLTYTYDDVGNRTGRTDATGTTTTTYDDIYRIIGETSPGSVTTSYAYDDAGNLTSLTDLAGTVSYTYNDANEVVSVTEPGSVTTTISYTTNGQPDQTSLPNGWTIDRDYDTSGRLVGVTAGDGTAVEVDRSYDYHDGTGDTALVHAETDGVAGQTFYYTYDQLERLDGMYTSSATVHHYSYDPAGNRLTHNDGGSTTIFSYNAANQLTNAGGVTVSHDGQGNLTATSAGDAYTYDEANRPVSITAGGTGPLAATYWGDTAVGRATLGSTSYVTSLLGVTAQTTGSTTVGYTRLPDGQVLSRREGTDIHYLLPDRLGSTQALVDDGGTVTTRYAYSPYGQTSVTAVTAGHVDQPFRFAGQHQDPTGLYKMGLRYYNPDQARWTQPDPALSLTALPFANTYTYVGNNPINGIDPTGAACSGLEWAGIVFGVAGILATGGYGATLLAGAYAGYGTGYCTA